MASKTPKDPAKAALRALAKAQREVEAAERQVAIDKLLRQACAWWPDPERKYVLNAIYRTMPVFILDNLEHRIDWPNPADANADCLTRVTTDHAGLLLPALDVVTMTWIDLDLFDPRGPFFRGYCMRSALDRRVLAYLGVNWRDGKDACAPYATWMAGQPRWGADQERITREVQAYCAALLGPPTVATLRAGHDDAAKLAALSIDLNQKLGPKYAHLRLKDA